MRLLLVLFIAGFFFAGCEAPVPEADDQPTISSADDISLYSMTFFNMPGTLTPDSLKKVLNKTNKAIDGLGYIANGYELLKTVKSENDTVYNYSYMIRGSWADQETYDKIHEAEAYQKAGGPKELWDAVMTNSIYYRMEVVE